MIVIARFEEVIIILNDNNEQKAQLEYIFGEKGYIKSYALITINDEDEKPLVRKFDENDGDFLSLNDGTGAGFIFNLSAEQIVDIVSPFKSIRGFIYGENLCPSTPYFYKRNRKGSYDSFPLEPIVSHFDFESLAPKCSDIWEELFINDYFQECLFTYLDQREMDEDEDEEE